MPAATPTMSPSMTSSSRAASSRPPRAPAGSRGRSTCKRCRPCLACRSPSMGAPSSPMSTGSSASRSTAGLRISRSASRSRTPRFRTARERVSLAGSDGPTRSRTTSPPHFSWSSPIAYTFIDLQGNPIDPATVESLTFKSSTGVSHTFEQGEHTDQHMLRGSRVVPTQAGPINKELYYTLESVMVSGSNVVNRAQQRYHPATESDWTVQLRYFFVDFNARDAFFGFPDRLGGQAGQPGRPRRTGTFRIGCELAARSAPPRRVSGQRRRTGLFAPGSADADARSIRGNEDHHLCRHGLRRDQCSRRSASVSCSLAGRNCSSFPFVSFATRHNWSNWFAPVSWRATAEDAAMNRDPAIAAPRSRSEWSSSAAVDAPAARPDPPCTGSSGGRRARPDAGADAASPGQHERRIGCHGGSERCPGPRLLLHLVQPPLVGPGEDRLPPARSLLQRRPEGAATAHSLGEGRRHRWLHRQLEGYRGPDAPPRAVDGSCGGRGFQARDHLSRARCQATAIRHRSDCGRFRLLPVPVRRQ